MAHAPASSSPPGGSGVIAFYQRTPLWARIVVALLLGALAGQAMGHHAAAFKPFSDVVLRLLQALATPLIFVAVIHALSRAQVSGRSGARLVGFLLINTTVAILVGLLVANVLQPGRSAALRVGTLPAQRAFDPVQDLIGKIPGSVVKPLAENDILGVIVIALAFGIALRVIRAQQQAEGKTGYRVAEELLEIAFRCVMVILHWVIQLVPLAVFAVVARVVGTTGFESFQSLGKFAAAVLIALALQSCYYMGMLRWFSWVRPPRLLRGGSDALLTAFSTASSAATMPITYACMKDKVGVREESAGIGVLVGGTFNHDGTALYEAMAALFISQVIGLHLGFGQQLLVVLMSILASVGAAGIPEAGLVTMIAVFSSVHLPVEYIPMLLTVDWFLDRCRTAINVLGDMTVTCLLEGKKRGPSPVELQPAETA